MHAFIVHSRLTFRGSLVSCSWDCMQRLIYRFSRDNSYYFCAFLGKNDVLSINFAELLAWMDCRLLAVILGPFYQFCAWNCIFHQCELIN